MIEPNSELQGAQRVRATAASSRKAPLDPQTKRERHSAIVKAWHLRKREKLLYVDGTTYFENHFEARYPRGFALDREAFMAAFLAFWGIGGVAPDVGPKGRNGIEGVSP